MLDEIDGDLVHEFSVLVVGLEPDDLLVTLVTKVIDFEVFSFSYNFKLSSRIGLPAFGLLAVERESNRMSFLVIRLAYIEACPGFRRNNRSGRNCHCYYCHNGCDCLCKFFHSSFLQKFLMCHS